MSAGADASEARTNMHQGAVSAGDSSPVVADEAQPHSPSHQTASINSSNSDTNDASTSNVRRSERPRNLSLVGKESKILSLNTFLTKSVNAQLVKNEQLLSNINNIEVSELNNTIFELEQEFEPIVKMHDEICTLCEGEPNKDIETMFNALCDDIQFIKQTIQEKQEDLANQEEEDARFREAEQAMEEAKAQFEEEMKLYQEIMQKRGTRRTSTQEQQATLMMATPATNSTQSSTVNHQNIETTAIDQQSEGAASQIQSLNPQISSTKPTADGLDVVKQLTGSLITAMNKVSTKRASVEPSIFSGEILEFID